MVHIQMADNMAGGDPAVIDIEAQGEPQAPDSKKSFPLWAKIGVSLVAAVAMIYGTAMMTSCMVRSAIKSHSVTDHGPSSTVASSRGIKKYFAKKLAFVKNTKQRTKEEFDYVKGLKLKLRKDLSHKQSDGKKITIPAGTEVTLKRFGKIMGRANTDKVVVDIHTVRSENRCCYMKMNVSAKKSSKM